VPDNIVNVVLHSIVAEIATNIDIDGFTLKLPSFGKFEVRHAGRDLSMSQIVQRTCKRI